MTGTFQLLIVDGEAELRDALSEQLMQSGDFNVTAVDSGQAAVNIVRTQRVDLVIIDVNLPDINGLEAVQLMRSNGFRAPILMLTLRAGDDDTIQGLEAGANDYITKPFRFAVLQARIRAHLRQHETSEDVVLTIGQYRFHPASKLLVDSKGSRLKLTEKETAILRFLYRADPQVVSRDTLLAEVWGYNANVTTHTLETHIYRLRQKIEEDPSSASILVTEPGGYRLIP